MRRNIFFYSPRKSNGVALLASLTGGYRVDADGCRSPRGGRLMRRGEHLLINWGSSSPIPEEYARSARLLLNQPSAVRLAISKYASCTQLASQSIPAVDVTLDVPVATSWLEGGGLVFLRDDGLSSGEGIEVYDGERRGTGLPALQKGQFFARYFKKTHEYRAHVMGGKLIDLQQKKRRSETDDNYDPMIRSHDNGWVFCHENLKGTDAERKAIGDTAIKAVSALGLDFGAVDILARYRRDGTLAKHIVCEINTGPGLEGLTSQRYTSALLQIHTPSE